MNKDELPVGESWRVSHDGTYKHYKTKKAAQKYHDQLRAEGKEPTVSTYCRES